MSALGLAAPVALTADALAFRERECSGFDTQRQDQRFFKRRDGAHRARVRRYG